MNNGKITKSRLNAALLLKKNIFFKTQLKTKWQPNFDLGFFWYYFVPLLKEIPFLTESAPSVAISRLSRMQFLLSLFLR